MKKGKIDKKTMAGYVVSLVVFAVAVALFFKGVTVISGRAERESTQTLKDGITRASVECYAIEGRYPPSVQYLEDNYGVQIDYDRYQVFYSGFASNVMPDITVVEQNP